MTAGRHTIFLRFTRCDAKGQALEGVAVEVARASIAGMIEHGFFLDIYHLDGSAERRTIGGKPYGFFETGSPKSYIPTVEFQSTYPSVRVLTKSQFQAMFGIERVRDERGHFAEG